MHPPYRIGNGYDLHTLSEARPLILGGIRIPHSHGLLGHSDADCLSHAIADALYGALGAPDIGQQFPDNSPENKNLNSQNILQHAAKLLEARNYQIQNIDTVLIAEQPKLNPYFGAMAEQLARSLRIEAQQISLKATTNEKVGPIGEHRAIAALACCLIAHKDTLNIDKPKPRP